VIFKKSISLIEKMGNSVKHYLLTTLKGGPQKDIEFLSLAHRKKREGQSIFDSFNLKAQIS